MGWLCIFWRIMLQGLAYHLVMVGVELGQLVDVHPFQLVLFTQLLVVVLDVDQSIVGDGDDAFARVAVDPSECSHLPHEDVVQARQLVQRLRSIVNLSSAATKPP